MVDLLYNGSAGTLLEDMGLGLEALALWESPSGPVIFARSGADGGVIAVSFNGAGQPQISDQHYFTEAEWAAADGRFEVMEVPSGPVLVFGTGGTGQLVGYDITGGTIGGLVTLDGANAAGPAGTRNAITDNGFVITAASDGTLRSFSVDVLDTLTQVDVQSDTSSSFHALPTAITTTVIGGQSYVLVADRASETSGPGVSVFSVADGTGALSHVAGFGTQTGLGLYDIPAEITAVEVGGRSYALVVSTSDNNSGATLSVMEISSTNGIFVTDHILDSLPTRFGNASALTVVEHNGWAYVAAAGGDDGLSLFALMPGGRLVHLQTLESTVADPLSSIGALTASVSGDVLSLLAVSGLREEITGLTADLSGQGIVAEGAASGGLLAGTAADDMLVGGLVSDTVTGGAGDDILRDGRGEDTLTGGAGADRFMLDWDGELDRISDFSAGEDVLDLALIPMLYTSAQITVTSMSWGVFLEFRGEELEVYSDNGGGLTEEQIFAAIDWTVDRPPLILSLEVIGTNNDDTLEGAENGDIIIGMRGDDLIYGYDGDDFIDGGKHDDTIYAGAGNDSVYGGHDRDLIYLEAGDDIFFNSNRVGENHSDTIDGGDGADTIDTAGGNDSVFGGAGDDSISTGDGDDSVYGGAGADYVALEEGDDLFDGQGSAENDTVFAEAGEDTVLGGEGDDLLYGQAGADSIEAGGGDDVIFGGDQYDTIFAGDGRDTVDGGNGADLIYLNEGADVFNDNALDGIAGADSVYGGWGNDTLRAEGGDDLLYGQGGADRLEGGLGNDSLYGGDQYDTLFGDAGDDLVDGGNGADLIEGGDGNDLLYGGAQYDTLTGGDGRDTVYGGNGRDLAFLGTGADVFVDNDLAGADGSDTVYGGWGNDTITGDAGDDYFDGQGNDDSITAGDGHDTVLGGDGRDFAALNAGHDFFIDSAEGGLEGRDTVYGGWGNDTIQGGGGDDSFFGNWDHDLIDGGDGNDTLSGDDGDDTLAGEAGDDLLTGGTGADSFVFAFGTSHDVISDFEQGADQVLIDTALTGAGTIADLINGAQVGGGGVTVNFATGGSVFFDGLTGTSGLADDFAFLV